MEATYAGIALTGPTVYETLESWSLPTEAEVDVVPRCRGDYVDLIPMGNRSAPVTLTFTRDKSTYGQACIFAALFASTMPQQGPLVLRDQGDGVESLIIYPDACFKRATPKITVKLGIQIELLFLTGKPPVGSESALPEVEATWDTWNYANVEDLDDRTINERQLVAP